jgi:hypothetical protein
MPNAKLGAKVDRYSFLVRILHSLLHTGLARRTNIAISLIDVSVQGTALNFSLRHAPHVVREGAAAIFVAEKHSSPRRGSRLPDRWGTYPALRFLLVAR